MALVLRKTGITRKFSLLRSIKGWRPANCRGNVFYSNSATILHSRGYKMSFGRSTAGVSRPTTLVDLASNYFKSLQASPLQEEKHDNQLMLTESASEPVLPDKLSQESQIPFMLSISESLSRKPKSKKAAKRVKDRKTTYRPFKSDTNISAMSLPLPFTSLAFTLKNKKEEPLRKTKSTYMPNLKTMFSSCACPCTKCPCPKLPPPCCESKPECVNIMKGYFYYPYGEWFCGPYKEKICDGPPCAKFSEGSSATETSCPPPCCKPCSPPKPPPCPPPCPSPPTCPCPPKCPPPVCSVFSNLMTSLFCPGELFEKSNDGEGPQVTRSDPEISTSSLQETPKDEYATSMDQKCQCRHCNFIAAQSAGFQNEHNSYADMPNSPEYATFQNAYHYTGVAGTMDPNAYAYQGASVMRRPSQNEDQTSSHATSMPCESSSNPYVFSVATPQNSNMIDSYANLEPLKIPSNAYNSYNVHDPNQAKRAAPSVASNPYYAAYTAYAYGAGPSGPGGHRAQTAQRYESNTRKYPQGRQANTTAFEDLWTPRGRSPVAGWQQCGPLIPE